MCSRERGGKQKIYHVLNIHSFFRFRQQIWELRKSIASNYIIKKIETDAYLVVATVGGEGASAEAGVWVEWIEAAAGAEMGAGAEAGAGAGAV